MRQSNEVLLLHALVEYNIAILHIVTRPKGTYYLRHERTTLALGNIPSILIGIYVAQCRLSSGCFSIKWKAESENMKIHGYYSNTSGSSRPLLVSHRLEDTTSPDGKKIRIRRENRDLHSKLLSLCAGPYAGKLNRHGDVIGILKEFSGIND